MNEPRSVFINPADFVSVSDEAGRVFYLPHATYNYLREHNSGGTARVVLQLTNSAAWITVSKAALLVMRDVDGLTADAARLRILRACVHGDIRYVGAGRNRRIDPIALDAWRLRLRERAIEQDE